MNESTRDNERWDRHIVKAVVVVWGRRSDNASGWWPQEDEVAVP